MQKITSCRYCKSLDIETDETLITENAVVLNSGIQVLCNDCQAEYTVYEKSQKLFNLSTVPVNRHLEVKENPRVLLRGLHLIEDEITAAA